MIRELGGRSLIVGAKLIRYVKRRLFAKRKGHQNPCHDQVNVLADAKAAKNRCRGAELHVLLVEEKVGVIELNDNWEWSLRHVKLQTTTERKPTQRNIFKLG